MPGASTQRPGALAPITATFDLSAAANIGDGRHHHTGSIFTSTDGRNPSLVWERSAIGSGWGGGWTGWNVGQSPIAFGGRIERDRTIAANTAHELEFKNSILSAAVDTIITQVMGAHGLILAPRLSPEALNMTREQTIEVQRQISQRWTQYVENPLECDQYGTSTLAELVGAALRSCLLSGESLMTFPFRQIRGAGSLTHVQLLAIEQLDATVTRTETNLNILKGVAYHDNRLFGYMIRPAKMGDTAGGAVAKLELAFNGAGRRRILHVKSMLHEARQVRGLPLVTAGLTDAHSHATLSELLIDKALVATAFAATITSDMPTRTALGQLAVNDALGHTPPDSFNEWAQQRAEFYGKEDRQALLKPVGATITHLALGDKLELNRDMSGVAGYDQILESFMKKAASAFGLSYESLSGDYSKSSYTAARLGEALPYEKTLKRRKQIAERIYATVYALWLEEQHMRGLIQIPDRALDFWSARNSWCEARWLGRPRVSPDEYRTAQTDVLNLENNIVSLHDILARNGDDFDAKIREIAEERKLLAELGLNLPGAVTSRNDFNENVDVDEPTQQPPSEPTPTPPSKRAARADNSTTPARRSTKRPSRFEALQADARANGRINVNSEIYVSPKEREHLDALDEQEV